MNTSTPLIPPIGGAKIPIIINYKKGWSGIKLPILNGVGGYHPPLFDRFINNLMR